MLRAEALLAVVEDGLVLSKLLEDNSDKAGPELINGEVETNRSFV